MPLYDHLNGGYTPITELRLDDTANSEDIGSVYRTKSRSKALVAFVVFLIATLCVGVGFASGNLLRFKGVNTFSTHAPCINPVTRREWRSLSVSEKRDYIKGVQCLRSKPSRLSLNQSLYDDFPYFHVFHGEPCTLV